MHIEGITMVTEELILKNIGRHINLDKTEADYFVSLLQSKTFKKKEFVLRPGEICKYEIFVTKGCLRSYNIDNNGFVHIGMFVVEDWWTADLHSFITQTPSATYIDALENTDVLMISKQNLEKLYEQVPKFERFYRIKFQNSLVTHVQRVLDNISLNAEDRYLNFNKKYPKLEQRIPQKQVAAYLGITPEFLSILRRKLATG
jgi:CRP-like cAMP-binding protein